MRSSTITFSKLPPIYEVPEDEPEKGRASYFIENKHLDFFRPSDDARRKISQIAFIGAGAFFLGILFMLFTTAFRFWRQQCGQYDASFRKEVLVSLS
ncbi:hypothetical protein F4805DRAFT_442655 [Annulohypoxylon moriforme]|nr:hypothetical protein F4805DRAFT_442655 [Annulohypoxylon moriforme]